MADAMNYPEDIKDFIYFYSFRDTDEVYTNGSRLIDVYRLAQALEHYYGVDIWELET